MAPGPDIEIRMPASAADHEAARALFGEYAESLGFSLDYQGFADELARFPGEYAPPTGACGSPSPVARRRAPSGCGGWRQTSAR